VTSYLDSSVLVAALVEDEPAHESCLQLMRGKSLVAWSHALAETYATLTGGRLGIRVSPAIATQLIEDSLLPRLQLIDLTGEDLMGTIRDTHSVGARGGAVYDFLHLTAARNASAKSLYTLNTRHFAVIMRKGDPEVKLPS
jgi:predicted nucleic acid-binding protein